MDLTNYFLEIFKIIGPCLTLAGFIALFISLICMLIDIIINAFTGKGMKF